MSRCKCKSMPGHILQVNHPTICARSPLGNISSSILQWILLPHAMRITNSFTFMHSAHAFIQSDFSEFNTYILISMCAPWGWNQFWPLRCKLNDLPNLQEHPQFTFTFHSRTVTSETQAIPADSNICILDQMWDKTPESRFTGALRRVARYATNPSQWPKKYVFYTKLCISHYLFENHKFTLLL